MYNSRPITPGDWKGAWGNNMYIDLISEKYKYETNQMEPNKNTDTYKLVKSKRQEDFTSLVNTFIKQGWECLGGIAVMDGYLCQAMQRK